ncbi:MAG: hypothetical protein JXA90_15030, partial [Planctomycetes bacterium]|nr:hypothetical protein [Planctomycetota bacterium]
LEGSRLSVLAWHYHDDDLPGAPADVDLEILGLPAAAGEAHLEHYRIDETRSNAFTAWKRMGSPQAPTAEQYALLETAGRLASLEGPRTARIEGSRVRVGFRLPRQAVSLLVLEWTEPAGESRIRRGTEPLFRGAMAVISVLAELASSRAECGSIGQTAATGVEAIRPLRAESSAGIRLRVPHRADLRLGWIESTDAPAAARVAADRAIGVELLQTFTPLDSRRGALVRTWLKCTGEGPVAIEGIDLLAGVLARDASGVDARYQELAPRSESWFGSPFWSGPDWTRVGRDWQHPGTDTPSVRSYRFDRDGRFEVRGRVYKGDVDGGGGDGIRAIIRFGDSVVWRAEIDGLDRQGAEPELTLDVKRGDVLRFIIHKRGEYYHDTTHWDPVIRSADGAEHRASQDFTIEKQGAGGWFYEMEVGSAGDREGPALRAFTLDLDEMTFPLTSASTSEATSASCLPVGVLSGADGGGGVAWAIAGDSMARDIAPAWRVSSLLSETGEPRLEISAQDPEGWTARRGETVELPSLVLLPFRGHPLRGWTGIAELLRGEEEPRAAVDPLRAVVGAAFRRLEGTESAPHEESPRGPPAAASRVPDLDLWSLLLEDWAREDGRASDGFSPLRAARKHLETARLLIEDLRALGGDGLLREEEILWNRLARAAGAGIVAREAADRLYLRSRWLRRRIALENPLLDFGELLFARRVPTSYSHLVMQYYGWRARPGGGLFVLEEPGYSLRTRDILRDRLGCGSVLEPRLSFDARRVVFSFVQTDGENRDPARLDNEHDVGFFHVWEADVDGSGLRQLTRGPFDDLMPTYLPGGAIAFCSTRRGGYARCFGAQFSPRWHVYTLHRMNPDGSDLRTISFHDTNEWFPSVLDDGRVLYSRWDYIDRDAVTHQNLWAARPDGSNPVALWGNATSRPHCAFQARPIPGTGKIIFTASAHHSITAGSIAIVDPRLAVNGLDAVTRITPEIPFPEAESRDIREYFSAPFPLSETCYLVAYSPRPLVWEPGANDPAALGIYLLDVFGRRELIFRDPEIGSTNPTPLRARPEPPLLPAAESAGSTALGEILLLDAYRGLEDVTGQRVKEIRVVQIFPKSTPVANTPPVGLAAEENARAILGTVAVEADGSARFLVPPRTPVLFQALDENGLAIQTMRTLTYLQPGEKVSCIGCHEHRQTAPANRTAIAALRPASRIEPGDLGGRPFSFVEVVQPILDRRCVSCHGGETTEGKIDLRTLPERGFTRSYWSLCGDASFWGEGTNPRNAAAALVPRFGARNQVEVTPPGGLYGAPGSRLLRLLREGHEGVRLSPDEMRRIAAWIDLNAIFYGTTDPEEQARQLRGEAIAMPRLR